jgi:hypothetical protein
VEVFKMGMGAEEIYLFQGARLHADHPKPAILSSFPASCNQ